jgi:hypothetical protein
MFVPKKSKIHANSVLAFDSGSDLFAVKVAFSVDNQID